MGKVLDVHANVLSLEAAPAASRSGAQTIHTGVDTQRLGGRAKLVVSGSNVSGTTPTYDAKIQEGDTLGGAYTDLKDLDGNVVKIVQATTGVFFKSVAFDLEAPKRFLRVVEDRGGTAPVYIASAVIEGASGEESPISNPAA